MTQFSSAGLEAESDGEIGEAALASDRDWSHSPAEPARQTTFAAFRHRNFRLYAIGMLISMAGSWMQIIAQGWLVYELSGSEWALGIVGFAAAIPALILSPWAGVIIDRTSRRGILYMTQTAAMIFAFLLAYLQSVDLGDRG